MKNLIRYGIKRIHGRCVEPQIQNIKLPFGNLIVPNNATEFNYLDTVTGYGCDIALIRKLFDEREIKGDVFGIDLNYGKEYYHENARDIVKKSLGDGTLFDRCKVSQGNALSLSFIDDLFERVSSIALIHHFSREERRKHFQEAYRVLKDGGILFGWTLSGEGIEEVARYKRDSRVKEWKQEHWGGIRAIVSSYLGTSEENIVRNVREYNKQFYEQVKMLLNGEGYHLSREGLNGTLTSIVNNELHDLSEYSSKTLSAIVEARESYYQKIKDGFDCDERAIGREIVLHFWRLNQRINELMTEFTIEKGVNLSSLDEKRIRNSILSDRLFFIEDLTEATINEDLEQVGFSNFFVYSFVGPGYEVMKSITFCARK